MNRIALIRSTQSFLTLQLRDGLKTADTDVLIEAYTFSINELAEISEKTRVMVVFVDGESSFNKSSLTYIKDVSIEKEIPIILCVYEDEEEFVTPLLKGANISKTFIHPLNLKEITECVQVIMESDAEEKKKILVVDDDGMYCIYVKGILGSRYTVLYETSGLSAVTKMSQIKPDLVLLDWEMPKLNGFTLFDCIKDESDLRDIPIAFLTSKNDVETVQKAATLGPEGYFLKSMAPEELVVGIDNLFAKRKALALTGSKAPVSSTITNSAINLFGGDSIF